MKPSKPVAETTAIKQPATGRPFPPGVSGNPAGRPPGTRNKLTQLFLEKLASHFEKNADEALDRALTESPVGYMGLIAKIMPKNLIAELTLTGTALDLDTDQRQRIAEEWLLTKENGNG